jgi:hypothetical protein
MLKWSWGGFVDDIMYFIIFIALPIILVTLYYHYKEKFIQWIKNISKN